VGSGRAFSIAGIDDDRDERITINVITINVLARRRHDAA
jgi:hypothetical protein